MRNKLYKILAAGFALALAFTLSCSSGDDGNGGGSNVVYGTPVAYEGETYETVVIGTHTWMARNLNFNAEGSACYGNSNANCATYGRLYDWATARTVCPTDDWHLPSDAEWDALITAVGGSSTAGKKLKARSGWNEYNGGLSGNGTDDYGFSALPGGNGNSNGSFNNVGNSGAWWSDTEYNASSAYGRDMSLSLTEVLKGNYGKAGLFSVRCVKD